MAEVNFDSLLDACIEALEGFTDFVECEALALALLETIEDMDFDYVSCRG